MKDGYLLTPTVVDARTEVTTELLSEDGFLVTFTDDTGKDQGGALKQLEFEQPFFIGIAVLNDERLDAFGALGGDAKADGVP